MRIQALIQAVVWVYRRAGAVSSGSQCAGQVHPGPGEGSGSEGEGEGPVVDASARLACCPLWGGC